jgi:hypothetical protein
LFTLSNNRLSPGRISASLAALVSCLKGSFVLVDVRNLVLLGRYTSLLDFPSDGKFSSLLMKWMVAPELMMIFCSQHFAMRRVHLFVFGVAVVGANFITFASSSSDSFLLLLSLLSGAQ